MGRLKRLRKSIYYVFLYKNYLSYSQNFTFRKLFNAIYNFYEYKLKRVKMNSFPSAYGIDIGNFCNLKCPLCPTGTNCPDRKKKFMFFEDYKNVFDKIKKYAFVVNLYNWGEPFLNKDILKIIEYTKKNKEINWLLDHFNHTERIQELADLGSNVELKPVKPKRKLVFED